MAKLTQKTKSKVISKIKKALKQVNIISINNIFDLLILDSDNILSYCHMVITQHQNNKGQNKP
jgi:hypothetical protein